ncbi:hypothetical protein [Candidatus Annandia pinicola]|uniref:hypothetical protein n=1 Tax=Candidatus Annandia pinicola TaxID=1345117 RepID=UPI001D001DAF|nr:hypothetical protein [Candidatus Annandia pinicola]
MIKDLSYFKTYILDYLYLKRLFYLFKKNKNNINLIKFDNIYKINDITKTILNIKKFTIIKLLIDDSKFIINNKFRNENYIKELIYLKYINIIIKKKPILLNINQCSKNNFFLINNFLKIINLNKINKKKSLFSIYTLNLSIYFLENNIKKIIRYVVIMFKLGIILEIKLNFKIKKKKFNIFFLDNNLKKIIYICKKISKVNKNFIISIKFNSNYKIYTSINEITIFKLLKKILIIKNIFSKKIPNFLPLE